MSWEKLFIIVVIALTFLIVLINISITRKKNCKGTTITIGGSRDLLIKVDKVTFEASSPVFFFLRRKEGEVIYGVPVNTNYDYYVAERREIPGGKWLFVAGSATVKVTSLSESGKEITVTTVYPNLGDVWSNIFLYITLMWLVDALVFVTVFILLPVVIRNSS